MHSKFQILIARKTLRKIVFLVVFVALFSIGNMAPTYAQGNSPETSPGAVVFLSADQVSFSASEAVTVHVTITNPHDYSIKILKWLTPVGGVVEEQLFTVLRAGQPVPYLGIMVKRAAPTEADYITLTAGESLTDDVNVATYYDLSVSNSYTIVYDVTSTEMYTGEDNNTGSLTSNAVQLFIDGHHRFIPEEITPQPQSVNGTNSFSKCSIAQQTDLIDARTNASTYATDAVSYLSSNKHGDRYTTWFGTYDSNRYSTVDSHFDNISSAIDTASISYDCGCTDSAYAWVYGWLPYNIHICKGFWSANMTGTDSKAGTLIHEISHFWVVAGTDDHEYGQSDSQALATSDPDLAIDNADSHEYFAENNPRLELNILSPTATEPGYAGENTNPVKMSIQVETTEGLSKSTFSVNIGGKAASVIIAQETSGTYMLEVMPPVQSSNGLFDLQVTAGTLTDSKANAVNYAVANNVDVDLVVDRSGSMSGTPMSAAKDASKQFVDFMQNGDMIGVVGFDDLVETTFPLTIIQAPSQTTPMFSDDMESGSGNWIANSPWARTTSSAHSGSYSWTDSPTGNYANGLDIALRTASAINVPASINTPVLAFWQKFAFESGYDNGYVEASANNGASWTTLASYTGTNSNWHRVEVNLSSYKGQNLLIRFRMHTDSSIAYDGWYIDDVSVGQGSSDTKNAAKSAIDTLYARGSTSIGGGLQRGQQQLSTLGNAAHPWSIVLLSDGWENTTPWVANVLPAIEASKTIVHTIGLGSSADQNLLMDIASQTGGTYSYAPDPDQLSEIYNTIVGAVANRQTLFVTTGTAQQGVTDQKDVVIDSTISEATFSVNWSNSANTIDLTLRKPDGTIITAATAVSDPNVAYVAGSTYKYYRIRKPTLVAGTWQVRISGGSISAALGKGVVADSSGQPYTARVTAVANLTMRSSLGQNNYRTGQPIKLIVTLSDNQPILGAMVTASIENPSQAAATIRAGTWIESNGDTRPDPDEVARMEAAARSPASVVTRQLYDDGLHGDGRANDGVYANEFTNAFRVGTYVFRFSASGRSNLGEPFIRQSQISSFIARNLMTGVDTTGVFRPSNGLLYLKNSNDTGIADAALNYGNPGDYPVVGDWDGDGTVTIGIYRNGYFYLRYSNTIGFAESIFRFGTPGDQPIAGDWNGDGVDTIGVYRPSTGQFLLRNSNSEGAADASFYLGNVGDVGVAGDWNGDGIDTTGVFRPSNGVIFLKNSNTTGIADIALNYGLPGDKPVMGDWNNDGLDTIGIYRNGTFYLRNENTNGFATIVFGLGNPGDIPIAGNWDGLP